MENIKNISWDDLDSPKIIKDSVDAAFIKCLDNKGFVDISFIKDLTSLSEEEILSNLDGAIFLNPTKYFNDYSYPYETSDEYLSGNILEKLKVAKEAAKINDRFKKNVNALKKVLPKGIDSEDIYIALGSPRIPAEYIQEFIFHLLGRAFWYNKSLAKKILL